MKASRLTSSAAALVYSSGGNTKLGALQKVRLSTRLNLLIVHAAVPGVCYLLIPCTAVIFFFFQSFACKCLFVDMVDPLFVLSYLLSVS